MNKKQRLVHPIEIIANVIENSIEMECFASGLKKMFPCFVLSTSLSVEMKKKFNRSTLKSILAIESRSTMMFQFVLNQFWFNAEKIMFYRVLAYSFFFCNYKHWSCNCKRKCSFKILCSSVKSKKKTDISLVQDDIIVEMDSRV